MELDDRPLIAATAPLGFGVDRVFGQYGSRNRANPVRVFCRYRLHGRLHRCAERTCEPAPELPSALSWLRLSSSCRDCARLGCSRERVALGRGAWDGELARSPTSSSRPILRCWSSLPMNGQRMRANPRWLASLERSYQATLRRLSSEGRATTCDPRACQVGYGILVMIEKRRERRRRPPWRAFGGES